MKRSLGYALCACAVALAVAIGHRATMRSSTLDRPGQALLDPLRDEAVRPGQLIRRLAPRPSDIIADVGSGPGYLTLPLARSVPLGRVVATDVREDYLDVLSGRVRAAGIGNVKSMVVRADDHGLPSATFDLVLLCQVDHYLTSRAAYFASLIAALRPHGRIAVVNHERHRLAVEAAAQTAALALVDHSSLSPGFFLNVYQARR